MDLELRKKVAYASGLWDEIYTPYEVSIDSIEHLFNMNDLNYTLTRFVQADGITSYSAKDTRSGIEIEYQPSAAYALCELYLAIKERE